MSSGSSTPPAVQYANRHLQKWLYHMQERDLARNVGHDLILLNYHVLAGSLYHRYTSCVTPTRPQLRISSCPSHVAHQMTDYSLVKSDTLRAEVLAPPNTRRHYNYITKPFLSVRTYISKVHS